MTLWKTDTSHNVTLALGLENNMYQLKLFKALKESKSNESLNDSAFELGRKLANKALLYKEGKSDKGSLDFARKAYIIITKL